LAQFAALVFYLRHHEGKVQQSALDEWMRVVRNLVTNSDIERPEEYGRALAGLRKLVPYSAEILMRLSDTDIGPIGFSPQQVREEILKARLILANSAWRVRIDRAEEHGYFSGQIEFLLEFCGVLGEAEKLPPAQLGDAVHADLQAAFDNYLSKAQTTFTASGLTRTKRTAPPHLWKRALLTVGDYLLPISSNHSFLTDPPTNADSWKRFLRDGGKREYLKALWDQIDANAEIEPQLDRVIMSASNLEPWRAAIVKHPDVISYCGEQKIRGGGQAEAIYLLKRRQMNGAHAELFSYVLSLELGNNAARQSLAPLSLQCYQSVTMTYIEPHVLLTVDRSERRLSFAVESTSGQFRIHISCAELEELPEVEVALCSEVKFVKEDGKLTRLVPRTDIHEVLQQVAQSLAKLPRIADHG
jgi:hypothetical protein